MIPSVEGYSGQIIEVPIDIAQVENMAGIKFALKYDHKMLTYRSASKTKFTEAFMHVVNQKRAGVLIVVMASAKGIDAQASRILNLYFTAAEGISEKIETYLDIRDIQLMSDQLQTVDCELEIHPVTVLPAPVHSGNKKDSVSAERQF